MASVAMTTLSSAAPNIVGQNPRHVSWAPESRKALKSKFQPPLPSHGITLPGGKRRVLLPVRWITAAQSSSSSSSSAQGEASVDAAGQDEDRTKKCLQDLADTLTLPPDFLSKLPTDLKVDLDDAAFALSRGPINQECGETVGNLVMGLSRALEGADAQTAAALAREVPSILDNLSNDPFSNAALGKRLQAAGKYLASTGQYGDGELLKLSKALLAAGEALSLNSPDTGEEAPPTENSRMIKFGDLQVELTAQRAYIGAAIAFVFGALCWKLAIGLADGGVDPSQYANSNSFSIASSLRGTLLTAAYGCTLLSAAAMAGLLGLASKLGPEDN